MRLILFDIDGTLIDCGSQVRPLFGQALRDVFGVSGDLDGYDFAGRTDPGIVVDLMLAAGLEEREVLARLPQVRDLYLKRLAGGLRRDGMRLLPGLPCLLERLAARADVALGLLTGNWEGGARLKLSRFDLNGYFSFGAFGDGQVNRLSLPPLALVRAGAATGHTFRPRDALIVGDSLLDIACARAHGLTVLAVATGKTPVSELAAAGPDWIIDDLRAAYRCDPIFSG